MHSMKDLFKLLSDVLPTFINLAESYTQSTTSGIAAEHRDSLDDNFYSDLHSQLSELSMRLCDLPVNLGEVRSCLLSYHLPLWAI
jgi:hypothetical protein